MPADPVGAVVPLLFLLLVVAGLGYGSYRYVRGFVSLFRGATTSRLAEPENDTPSTRRRQINAAQLNAAEGAVSQAAAPASAIDFAAEFQAQAAASDERRKDRIRAHVERAAPPLSEADRAVIAKSLGACLAIRHVFPPRLPQRSMSFLGGDPLAPDNLDWPTVHNREGLLEPLTFMAQIDCNSLPEGPLRALLPSDGFLYFFAPMSGAHDATAWHFMCRSVAGKAKASWGPQHSGFLEPIGGKDEAKYRTSWMNWRARPEYPTSYPRVEVELGWIAETPEEAEDEAEAGGGFPWELAVKQRRERLAEFHGGPLEHDALLSAYQKPTDSLWIPYPGFPANWHAVEVVLGYLKVYVEQEKAEIERRLEAGETSELAAAKAAYGDFDYRRSAVLSRVNIGQQDRPMPVPDDFKTDFLDLLEWVRGGGLPAPVVDRTYIQKKLPLVLNEWLSDAAIASAEVGLRDEEGARLIPAVAVDALRARHSVLRSPQFERSGEARQHQLLGRGSCVQTAADDMGEEHLLLLQLSPDTALGWDMGDAGVLQYWIRPDDLAARRFENVIATFESH